MADLAQPSINAGARSFLARWDRRFHSLQSRVARYGLAIVSVTVALGLSLALQYYQFRGVEVPVLTLAIAVTTWYAGNGPAVVAIILSSLCFDYFYGALLLPRNYQQRPALLFHRDSFFGSGVWPKTRFSSELK